MLSYSFSSTKIQRKAKLEQLNDAATVMKILRVRSQGRDMHKLNQRKFELCDETWKLNEFCYYFVFISIRKDIFMAFC